MNRVRKIAVRLAARILRRFPAATDILLDAMQANYHEDLDAAADCATPLQDTVFIHDEGPEPDR